MLFTVRSVYIDFLVYTFLFLSTIFVNKYILSVLNFTYPTVFQAWQTLIGVIILKYMSLRKKLDVSYLDKSSALQLLPHCVFFVGAIVAGSKALSKLPIPVFTSLCNLPVAFIFLLDCYGGSVVKLVPVTAALLTLGACIAIVILDVSLPFADSGYSWLLAHVIFITAQILHTRCADVRSTEFDRIYYNNMFSVVILAPSSLYLEEAFSALHFQHRRQLRFYAGCLCSGVLGALLQLWTARGARTGGRAFPRVQAAARAIAAALSVLVFGRGDLLPAVWLGVVANLLATGFIPAETVADTPEDEHLAALTV